MSPTRKERAIREEEIGRLEEETEKRMHEVADYLPDPEAIRSRARRISERAFRHFRRAEALREGTDDDSEPGD